MKYFPLLAGVALVGFSFANQEPVNPDLKAAASALQKAQSLTLKLGVAKLPAASEEVTVTYSKPNLYRIESGTTLIVSDGKKVVTLDKAANTYTESPIDLAATRGDAVAGWAAFFNAKAFAEAKSVATGAKRRIKGQGVTEVVVTMPNHVLTLYVDDKLGVPRGASIRVEQGGKGVETLAIAEELTVGAEPMSADAFVFVAPAGAKLHEAPKVETVPYGKVQAIFYRSCAGCHGSSGGLSLGNHASVMAGAAGRAVVSPGDPANSRLVQYISGSRPRMPKNAPPLPANDVKAVSDWVAGGAKAQ
ncbi:MAG: c-type cytochrome domain-containing protein [Fimbriimonadales bacterium]